VIDHSPPRIKVHKDTLSQSQPVQMHQPHQQPPKPAPQVSSTRGKRDITQPASVAKPLSDGQIDLLGTGHSTATESQWDSDNSDRLSDHQLAPNRNHPLPVPRPRVATPTHDLPGIRTAADIHTPERNANTTAGVRTGNTEDDGDDDDDDNEDWDVSELQGLDPDIPAAKTPILTSQPVPGGNTRDKALIIQQQLEGRQGKKPAGAIDLAPGTTAAGHRSSNAQDGQRDDDDDSLPSISSTDIDDEDQTHAKARLAVPARTSIGQTNSSNTYGSSMWNVSAKAVTTVNSKIQKSGTDTEDDQWDSPDMDD
jgi:hypothetical protein